MINIRPNGKNIVGNESGFTLLEILAVIVILGILSVVAVPKYFDLQSKAKERAMDASQAEAISRINGWFATEVLDGRPPAEIQYTQETLGLDDFGDEFDATITSDAFAETIVITINAAVDTEGRGTLAGATQRTVRVPRPGL